MQILGQLKNQAPLQVLFSWPFMRVCLCPVMNKPAKLLLSIGEAAAALGEAVATMRPWRKGRLPRSPPDPLRAPESLHEYIFTTARECPGCTRMTDRSVKSATRTFQLLEVFEKARRPLRVAAIVDSMDAPQSSVSMLLKTMVAEGYMDFNPATREYCPSARITNLGEWVMRLPRPPDALHDSLQRLAQMTDETVLLGRLTGVHMQYITVIDSSYELRFAPPSGTRRPVHRSGIGIMLLSTLTDESVRGLLRRLNAQIDHKRDRADVQEVMKQVRLAREQGYCLSSSGTTPGAGVISMVLPTLIRGRRLGVGVGAPLDRLQLHMSDILDAMTEVASQC